MYDQQKVVAMLYLFYTDSPYMYCKIGQRNFYRLCADHITFVAFNFGKSRKKYSYLENIGGAVAPSCPPPLPVPLELSYVFSYLPVSLCSLYSLTCCP